MSKDKDVLKSNETQFTISGKIKTTILISIVLSILGLGALTADVLWLKERVKNLEGLSAKNIESHTTILSSLIRIEENSKFLKEKIEDLKNRTNE